MRPILRDNRLYQRHDVKPTGARDSGREIKKS